LKVLLAANDLDHPAKWLPTPQFPQDPPTPTPSPAHPPCSSWGPGLTSPALRQYLQLQGLKVLLATT